VFRWKDRNGAVGQAAYQFRLARKNVQDLIDQMTPDEVEQQKKDFGPDHPKFNAEGQLVDVLAFVLGSEDAKFYGYFCTGPNSISTRQWTQFKNDVEREIQRRDHLDDFLKFWKSNPSNPENSRTTKVDNAVVALTVGAIPRGEEPIDLNAPLDERLV
jgi:hypothetical protein